MKIILLTAVLAACTPTPVTPAPDADGSPAPSDPCTAACAALAAATCPMGGATTCASFMQTLSSSGKVSEPDSGKPLTCADVALVKTKADAVRLGFVCQ